MVRVTSPSVGLVIAAGRGSRLGALTHELPKCLLRVGSDTVLEKILTAMEVIDVSETWGILGHQAELLRGHFDHSIINERYASTNVLGSFALARPLIRRCAETGQPLIVSYSDIAVAPSFFVPLRESEGDITLLCDPAWRDRYVGRTDHPASEAELVDVRDGRYFRGGKGLDGDSRARPQRAQLVEFVGALRLGPLGCASILHVLDGLASGRSPLLTHGLGLGRAYLTDAFNLMADAGTVIDITIATSSWQEIDTPQDLATARLMDLNA